jgi:hypothetical protein
LAAAVFDWLLSLTIGAAMIALVTAIYLGHPNDRYETASAAAVGTVVAIRFDPQATVADLTKFLDAYNASLVGGPGPGGFYRVGFLDVALPKDEAAKLVGRLRREQIVRFVAVE